MLEGDVYDMVGGYVMSVFEWVLLVGDEVFFDSGIL